MTTTKPTYLLTPDLYEQGAAQVSWQDTGARQYELDISFDEDFAAASRGKTWADLDMAAWAWPSQEGQGGLPWRQMEALPAQGLKWRNLEFAGQSWNQWEQAPAATWRWLQEQPVRFTVYSGQGGEVAAPDQGRTWNNMDSAAQGWAFQEGAEGLSWKGLELLPSVGLTWHQHEQDSHTWSGWESVYTGWTAFENQPTRGLCWNSLDGRWRSWREREDPAGTGFLSWRQMEQLPPDNQTQRGAGIGIPLYTKSSMLRVRAVDDKAAPSDYLTTAMLAHLPRSLAGYKPPCLHIPALREGRTAEITWGDLYGASGYVLERKCGGAYEARYNGPGRTVSHPAGCRAPEEYYYGPDCKKHLACTDQVPYGQKTAWYRVKGYNTTGHSGYLEVAEVAILPVFYREGKATLTVAKDQSVYLHVACAAAYDMEKVPLTLEYDGGALQLTDLAAQQGAKAVGQADVYPGLRLTAGGSGRIKFQFEQALPADCAYSGLLTLLEFKALRSTTTVLTIQ